MMTNFEKYFDLAIEEMRKCQIEPRSDGKIDPAVGAVILLPDGRCFSAHRAELRRGNHAEFTLLERKLIDVDCTGSIMFVTLEPCAIGSFSFPKHACCEWIVSARVKTIYVGVGDPDPNVEGEGIKFLKENGVEVKSFPKEYQEIIWTYNKEFEKQAKARLKKDVKKRTMHILKEIIASDKGLNLLSEKALIEYSNALGYECYRDKVKVIDHLLDMELIFKDDNGNYKITKYALVLFGENPSLKMPQACIKFLFHYKSGDIYQATYDGPMIIAVNDAIKRI